MITKEFAENFSREWVASWNSHNLEQILSHYHDDFVMSSPKIVTIAKEKSGVLQGKQKIRAYWEKALNLVPDLHFTLLNTFVCADSIIIYYEGVSGLAAEVFFFDDSGKVIKAAAHYE